MINKKALVKNHRGNLQIKFSRCCKWLS